MKWPNNKKCAVCLTFDLDAEISWRNILRRHGISRDNPVVLSQGKYGPEVGLPRILRMLEKNNIKAGFFVPGEVAERYPEAIADIHNAGHEIGHHGYSHTNPARCSLEEEMEEFQLGFAILEDIIGERPRGYRAPAADMSENTLSLLADNNLIYDSTMMGRDLPYIVRVGDHRIVELPIRWLLDDWVHFGFNYFPPLEYQSGVSSSRNIFEMWIDEFEAVYEERLYYMLVMHPQIMGVPSRTAMLDKLVNEMKSKGDVWFATPLQITQYCLKTLEGENE